MKFARELWCWCFVSFLRLLLAESETSTLDTTSSAERTTSALPHAGTTFNPTSETIRKSVENKSSNSETMSPPSTPLQGTEDATIRTMESTLSSEPSIETKTENTTAKQNTTALINKLSDQIREIILHFQQPNPVGFPGQTILQDPLPAPNVTENLGLFGNSKFYNITIHGLSNFTTDSINMLLDQMEVYVKITIANVFIYGNYTVSNMFFTSEGPFNLTLINVAAEGVVSLVVDPDGSLRASRSITKMNYKNLKIHLGSKNVSTPLSPVVSAAGMTIISAVQPYIQARINERLTVEINKQLRDGPKFPGLDKVSPVDLAVLEGRRYVGRKYDPYVIPKMVDYDAEFLAFKVGPVTLHGLSKFARVGDVSVGVLNKTATIKIRMVTGRLHGDCKFHFDFGKVPQRPGRHGQTKFSASHLQFEATVHQPFNLTQKPHLADLQLEVGHVQAQLDGHGDFDYLVELSVRFLPEYLRYFIVDALEDPIKRHIQNDILDHVDMKELIASNFPLFGRLLLERKP